MRDEVSIEWVHVGDRLHYILIRDLTMRVPDEVLLTQAQAREVCQRLGVLLAELGRGVESV